MLSSMTHWAAHPLHAVPYIVLGDCAASATMRIPMAESTESALRLLIRQVSERALQGGGMDRQIYDALSEASAALASPAVAGRIREDALRAVQARLCACEPAPIVAVA